MDERLATARLTVDLRALKRNWRQLDGLAPEAATGAAIKANGYGLGLEQVAVALCEAGCRHFFVAIPHEGVRARQVVPDAEIFVLAGLTGDNAAFYHEADLTPVLNSLGDIALWAEWSRKSGHRRPCAIHIDTGMNRLGLTIAEARALATDEAHRHSVTPSLLMSHLACADDSANAMTGRQAALFEEIRAFFPNVRASLVNSGGLLSGICQPHDIARPGIALYGGEAIDGSVGPVEAVATLEGRILQVRGATRGETVGYGAAAKLRRNSRIAIVGLGYGDGLMRSASGSGVPLRNFSHGAIGHLSGHAVPVLGRVSMDLTAFDVTDVPEADMDKSEWIEIFGKNVAVDDFARAAGTIGYEVLTAMGPRSHRVYLGRQ